MRGVLETYRKEAHVSQSQLTTFMLCPLKYRFAYVDRLKPAFVPAALAFGSALHGAIATYFRVLKEGKEKLPLGMLQEEFQCLWREKVDGEPVHFRGTSGPKEMEELGLRMLEVFHKEAGESDVVAVEEPFSVPILDPATGETLEPALVGIFDLVERDDSGAVVIVDFKTASRKYTDFQVENSLQLALYAYAATFNGLTDGDDVLLRFDVLIKTKSPQLQRYYLARDGGDHRRAFRALREVLRAIEAGAFFPNPGPHCLDCPFQKPCQKWQTA